MDESEVDLRNIFGLLQRQFRLIAITFVVVMAITAIVTLSLTPIYTTSALVMVDPSQKNLLDPDAATTGSSSDSARIDSEVEILRSDSLLLKVIEAENLTSDANVGVRLSLRDRLLTFLRLAEPPEPNAASALNQALNNLRSAISIQRRGLTYLIAVQARSEDPEQAARLANAVAEAYINDQVASKVASILASRDILEARITQARQAITSSEGAFDDFIEQNTARITADSGNTDFARQQQQIDRLAAAREESNELLNSVNTGIAEGNFESIVSSLQTQALTELESQRAELLNQIANPPTTTTAESLNSQLQDIEDQLRQEAVREVSRIEDTIASSEQQEEELREDLRSTLLDSSLPADILTELFELQQNASLARTQYQTLLSRAQDLEAQADLQLADSRIVSPALPPETPSFPSVTLFMAIAALLALVLGVALAVLYENFIGGFTSEGQMASVLKTRVGAAVPRQRGKSERESVADMVVTQPLSIFSESVRRLRATLDQSVKPTETDGAKNAQVIMVGSTAPNEGKTTLALSLARSYALSERNVLLIDCDLRKPSLHRHLGIEPNQGLLDFLKGTLGDQITSIISHDTLTSATIVVGARRSDLPTDQLLTSASFKRMIQACQKAFDVVIIDTPPVGPVVDSLYVAPFADAIVFVTRWASTSQIDAKRAVASLAEVKRPTTEIISVINQQDVARASYMRKYGGYYAEVT